MKQRKKYEEMFNIVRESIHRLDPYSLIEGGSPPDEFDSEIASIVTQLRRCKSGRDISHAIARVLNSSFNENYPSDSFVDEGNKIYEQLENNGFI